LILAAAVAAVMPMPAAAVERWYSRGLYAAIQPRLTAASNLVGFSLFDVLGLGALVILAAAWWRGLRARGVRGLPRLLWRTTVAGAIVYLWFLATWGLNYRREKLTARLDFDEARVTRAAIAAIAVEAADEATARREPALAASSHALSILDLQPVLREPFARTLSQLGAVRTTPSRPKWSLLSLIFPFMGVDGMTDPFLLESLVRTDLLPFERPFVLAHEWAHLAGFADESEASYVAFLTCLQGDPGAQYSGWVLMYGQTMAALPEADRPAIQSRLGPGPTGDLRALAEKTRREIHPAASDASRAAYDRFLRANRLDSGIRSYDEVTRLLAGTRRAEGFAPMLRRPIGDAGR
jgi:hypothetical protein